MLSSRLFLNSHRVLTTTLASRLYASLTFFRFSLSFFITPMFIYPRRLCVWAFRRCDEMRSWCGASYHFQDAVSQFN